MEKQRESSKPVGGIIGKVLLPVVHNAVKGYAGSDANLGQITPKGYILPSRQSVAINKARGTMSSTKRTKAPSLF